MTDSRNSSLDGGHASALKGRKWELVVVAGYAFIVGGATTVAALGMDKSIALYAAAAAISAALSWMFLEGWRTPILLRRAIEVGTVAALVYPTMAALTGLVYQSVASWLELPWIARLDSPEDAIGVGLLALIGAPFALAAGVLGGGFYWLVRRRLVDPGR